MSKLPAILGYLWAALCTMIGVKTVDDRDFADTNAEDLADGLKTRDLNQTHLRLLRPAEQSGLL